MDGEMGASGAVGIAHKSLIGGAPADLRSHTLPQTVAHVAQLREVPSPESLVRVVALDGPAGTGKSSVARALAQALGWRFVDTGATYRAATLAAVRAQVDLADTTTLTALVGQAQIELLTDPSAPAVLLDGVDVSREVRSPDVTARVSQVSAIPGIRRMLIAVQRNAMGVEGAVVEGRDIATVVAPYAALKIYLDARPEVRAARRAGELVVGQLSSVEQDLARRDNCDNQTNKLSASEGAVHFDTSDLTFNQVVAALSGMVEASGLLRPSAS